MAGIKRSSVRDQRALFFLGCFCSAGARGPGRVFRFPLPRPSGLPTHPQRPGGDPLNPEGESRSGRLAEKALYCALEEIAHRFFRAPAARRSDFVCAPCGRAFSPLSVTAQSAVTPPPRGEPSGPASITTKFVVRQSHKKSSPYHKVSRCPRACTWLSLRESWRGAPERGASPACGRGAAAGGEEGKNGE